MELELVPVFDAIKDFPSEAVIAELFFFLFPSLQLTIYQASVKKFFSVITIVEIIADSQHEITYLRS